MGVWEINPLLTALFYLDAYLHPYFVAREIQHEASRRVFVAGDTFSEPALPGRQGNWKFLPRFVWKCHVSIGHLTKLILDVPVLSLHQAGMVTMVPPDSKNGTTASFCVGSSLSQEGSSLTTSYLLRYEFSHPFLTSFYSCTDCLPAPPGPTDTPLSRAAATRVEKLH